MIVPAIAVVYYGWEDSEVLDRPADVEFDVEVQELFEGRWSKGLKCAKLVCQDQECYGGHGLWKLHLSCLQFGFCHKISMDKATIG